MVFGGHKQQTSSHEDGADARWHSPLPSHIPLAHRRLLQDRETACTHVRKSQTRRESRSVWLPLLLRLLSVNVGTSLTVPVMSSAPPACLPPHVVRTYCSLPDVSVVSTGRTPCSLVSSAAVPCQHTHTERPPLYVVVLVGRGLQDLEHALMAPPRRLLHGFWCLWSLVQQNHRKPSGRATDCRPHRSRHDPV